MKPTGITAVLVEKGVEFAVQLLADAVDALCKELGHAPVFSKDAPPETKSEDADNG